MVDVAFAALIGATFVGAAKTKPPSAPVVCAVVSIPITLCKAPLTVTNKLMLGVLLSNILEGSLALTLSINSSLV